MAPEQLVAILALLTVATREMLWLCAFGIAISSIDDLAADLLWLGRVAGRRQALPPAPATPGHFAILVPAWDESAVIAPMLRRLLATLAYPHYRVFVGCYPNDPATAAAIATVADARLTLVRTEAPGPTTKADCLNQLWRAAQQHARASGCAYKAIVLHDAEDVVHPQSLAVYDRYIPACAMVQLPVRPFADPQSRWVSGHYIDEFAESHCKDMMLRSALGAPLPSAGVGTAIAWGAMERLAGPQDKPFDSTSLTEDYEIGHRLHAMGLRAIMVRTRARGELVATREFFPASVEGAVRQKSRWLTGIALSGWDRLGWGGDWRARWMLSRDRKGLFSAAVTMVAYGAAVLWLAQWLARRMLEADTGVALPPLLGPDGSLLRAILWLNSALLGWRLLLRALFVWRAEGWAEALRSLPRALVGNAVNFLAALRAVERYRAALDAGEALAWDKTAHRFPEGAGNG